MSFSAYKIERYAEIMAERLCVGFDEFRSNGTLDRKLVDDMSLDQELLSQYDRVRRSLERRRGSLPGSMRARIDGYRMRREWRWRFEEYEVFCCEEAMKLYNLFRMQTLHIPHGVEFVRITLDGLKKMTPGEILVRMPRLDALAHSENTLRYTLDLAKMMLGLEPSDAVHGALAGVIGCFEYGCHGNEHTPGVYVQVTPRFQRGDTDEIHELMSRYDATATEAFTFAMTANVVYRPRCECVFCANHMQRYRGNNDRFLDGCHCIDCDRRRHIFFTRRAAEQRAANERRRRDERDFILRTQSATGTSTTNAFTVPTWATTTTTTFEDVERAVRALREATTIARRDD